jgi:hypothetical protein
MTTVVTAFYEIKSKFTPEKYWNWIRFFMQIPCNLVLFTSPDLVDRFKSMREDIHIIPLEFEKLYHYKYYEKYLEHTKLDYNKSHTPELYIIWAEKTKFVQKTIELNPYNSQKFVWCDIGVVRQPQFLHVFKNFPKTDKIVEDKMNFLLLQPFTELEKQEGYFNYGKVRIGGGIHAGGIDIWKKYDKLWDEMLEHYFEDNRFAGQDQLIIGSIYLKNPDMFHLIIPKSYGGDPWFYLLYYWST